MIYLKKFNEGLRSVDIDSFCNKHGIRNYTINSDGTIDVRGNVLLKSLTEIPIQFNRISGSFYCSHNKLKSLKGSPREVEGSFYCSNNYLTSLKFGPEKVGENFICEGNKLKTLSGAPREVGDSFYCFLNDLTSLSGSPEVIVGDFNCMGNKLTSLKGSPKKVGGDFICYDNYIETLKYFPEEVNGDFICYDNPLPDLILENIGHIKLICQEAEDFSIWRSDGSLDERRFKYMIDILKEEGKI